MKIKNIITIIFISLSALPVLSQTKETLNAHAAAHKAQLARAKSSQIDKSVIQEYLKFDVERREDAVLGLNMFSPETETLVNDLLKEANSHLGKRYRSGAKGPSAFDCSGFSSYVFRQFGYSLGASSGAQFTQGEAVEKNNLRKGDLVFFTGRNSRRSTVGHVGIVVSADNEKGTFRFIHASTSQGIRIDSNDGYYSRRYLGARRLISE